MVRRLRATHQLEPPGSEQEYASLNTAGFPGSATQGLGKGGSAPMEGQSPPEDGCGEWSSKGYFPMLLRDR